MGQPVETPSSATMSHLSSSKKLVFAVVSCILIGLVAAAAAEILLRLRGVAPFHPVAVGIDVDPGGKFFTPHQALGYTHLSGKFRVTLGDGYSFNVTHLPTTLRITHRLDTYETHNHRPEIWIFGCSYTHGWSLNDDETYPWILQARLPEYEVVNYGVSGYGTIHSLIQFKSDLEARRPVVAVLAYAGFHDERNTFLRNRAKFMVAWNRLGPTVQPYARFDRSGRLQHGKADVEFAEFPLMRYSSLAHLIEMRYDAFEQRFQKSHSVSELLVKEMATLAEKQRVRFVVAGISTDPETHAMLDYARDNGMNAVDISVDLEDRANSNKPHDPHPSAVANRRYAQALEAYLRTEILK